MSSAAVYIMVVNVVFTANMGVLMNNKCLFLQILSAHGIWSLCARIELSVCSSLWCVTARGTAQTDLMRMQRMLAAVRAMLC